jgi:hypothetical protein
MRHTPLKGSRSLTASSVLRACSSYPFRACPIICFDDGRDEGTLLNIPPMEIINPQKL